MNDMKIKVKNKSHSREIQKEGKRLGFYFSAVRKDTHLDKPFLFFNYEDMSVTWDDNELRFEDHPHTETTLEELKAM